MEIADKYLEIRKKVCREFEINTDKKDVEYLTLIEELQKILAKNNIEEMTADEMHAQQIKLKNLRKNIHDLNEKNFRLTSKYLGDKKFMRIHKKFVSKFSQQKIFEILVLMKKSVDDELFQNFFVTDNKDYFQSEVLRFARKIFKKFSITVTRDEIKNFAEIVAQEYLNERNF